MATLKEAVPLEDVEQKNFVKWLRDNNLKHFRVPNETYTKSHKQRSKNTALGVVRGVPDIFVIVNNRLIAIEMKRLSGSTTSDEQREWIKLLNEAGIPARVCKGCEEAKRFVIEMGGPAEPEDDGTVF